MVGCHNNSRGGVHVIDDAGADQPPAGLVEIQQRACLLNSAVCCNHDLQLGNLI
jgi:hypothetical protein